LIDQLIAIGRALIVIGAVNFALEGRLFGKLKIWERPLLLFASFGLIFPDEAVAVSALAIVCALVVWNAHVNRARKTA
jgi:TRAP-type uncharacterized transport system fused permease subunit